jgi:peptide/nickel transport system ATP-binding protein
MIESDGTPPNGALMQAPPAKEPVLRVEDLSVDYLGAAEPARVVSELCFCIGPSQTLALVGESGCGKSVSVLAMLGLLPERHFRMYARRVLFEGIDIFEGGRRNLKGILGRRIGMIFQEPMTSLNPTMTVGEQVAEVLRFHLGLDRRSARVRTIELFDRVRIPKAAHRIDDYPFAFSGGMRQRVMIALALACAPTLLIADEPTTALDVTVQAEIFSLLRDLQSESGTALLLITHDLGVVAEMADEVAVMYAGRIVERSSSTSLLVSPHHPYTIGLLGASPEWDSVTRRLTPIDGRVPLPTERMDGCRFAPRCPFEIGPCRKSIPPLDQVAAAHDVACIRAPLEPLSS